ncbi:V-type immunoglobulin domain-containing suppressor of T-cell activation [Thamnophis elegans]|uniref:V-type immunoglobulin domain-containing suppressor of T-cell activation n=1 Tax=Thamnophis elegans TaxID=35005 RepID=UPI001377C528|nr:V-type immunoglobulin domain-containing suppressor of T-cell activation [Thamnophis elegans]
MEASAKWWLLVQLGLLLTRLPGHSVAFETITPYSLYVCPEGQNLTLTCKISGVVANHHNFLAVWYFSNKDDRSCSQGKHIHNITAKQLHHEAETHHRQLHGNVTAEKYPHGHQVNYYGLEFFSNHHDTFHVFIANLTLQDRGYYCCYIIETMIEKKKPHILHRSHGFMELRIQKGNRSFTNCTFHLDDNTETTIAVTIATVACIIGILCFPLILLLIYKQRQLITNRRAHELVRLDSNGHGIENPVFDAVSDVESESRIRPQLSFMASRQASESDRHLLSQPNTPLSPPAPGECFFPSLDPVPDSPNLTKEQSKEDDVF